jgi:hypothetical protein
MPPPQSSSHHYPQPSPTLQYETTNFTATPYHDKRMVSQIQKSLNRAVHPPHISSYTPFNSSGGNIVSYSTVSVVSPTHTRVPASQQQYSNYEPHQIGGGSPKSPMPKVVNLQYNSPMGLYSASAVKEELFKKLG